MSDRQKGASFHRRLWLWLLIILLIGLLMVPVLAIGLAIQKAGWDHFKRRGSKLPPREEDSTGSLQPNETRFSLRERVEKIAAAAISIPKLQSRIHRVQIETSAPSTKIASDSVHRILRDKNHQFVEAIDADKIRIVVILASHDWPDLSGSLQVAAEKDGFVYHGPEQTGTADGADSMVAEIEILRRPAPASR